MQGIAGVLHPEEFWEQRHAVESRQHRPSLAIHHDVDVIGGFGFPLKNGECLVAPGDGYAWNAARIEHLTNLCAGIDLGAAPRAANPSGKVDVLLSFPGSYTYGHWVVDMAARIERVVSVIDRDRLAFIVPGPQQDWMRFHLDAYGIAPDAVIPISDGQVYRSATLALPLVRLSAYLPRFPHTQSFARLKAYGHQLAERSGTYGERLFIRHRAQTSLGGRNVLGNEAEVETELEKLGFMSICPADMPINEQISAFAQAKAIVGEASSALHNIIYATEAKLVVLNSPSHKARLHFSICKLLDHTCEYLFGCDTADGTFLCDLISLRDVVSSRIVSPG